MGLILLIVIVAILGGFLGNLLEFAAWVIGIFAVLGAILGFVAYRAFERLRSKVT